MCLYQYTFLSFMTEIMKNGGICGMPTDTVYVLVAACNRPQAVEKAYRSVTFPTYSIFQVSR